MKAIIYSTPTCASCKQVKRFLDGRGIAYEVIDLETNPALYQHLMDKTGYKTVPIIQYGRKFVSGFNAGELMKMLGEV